MVRFPEIGRSCNATIAGVLAALVIPVRARIDAPSTQQSAISSLEDICEKVQTPLQRLEHGLLPWVNFSIMPLFALANADVAFGGSSLAAALADRVAFGIVLGLVIGKTVGIFVLQASPLQQTWRSFQAKSTGATYSAWQ